MEYFPNDMPNIISDPNVSMYADDHQVFVANETTKSVEKILVDNGERMTKWYQDNLLKVNCDKYQAMVLGNPKGERNVDLDICGEKVEQSQSRENDPSLSSFSLVTIHQDPRCKPR